MVFFVLAFVLFLVGFWIEWHITHIERQRTWVLVCNLLGMIAALSLLSLSLTN